MGINVLCKHCVVVFPYKDIKLKTKDIYLECGKHLVLAYYNCPECGQQFDIMVDDSNTLKALNRYQAHIQYIHSLYGQNKRPSKSDIGKMDRLQKELKHKRDKLNVIHKNSVYQYESKSYKLELNVPEHISGEGQ